MSWERKNKGISFDSNEAAKIIFGESESSTLSSFLGRKDLRKGTEKKETSTEIREGKDYNSFGKTRKIEF